MQTNEQVRAAALEDAARSFERVMSRSDVVDIGWVIDGLRERALATSAAPERSGEIAGYQKKYLCTISNDVWSDWEETSEKYYLECMKYPCANVQVRPVYAAPEADSSSAAPSDGPKPIYKHNDDGTVSFVNWDECWRHSQAAPAPTGESLSAADYKLQDGETIRYARIGNIEGSLGGPFMTDSDQHGVWDVAMVFKAGNKRPSKIFLDQFYHCAALATPRQTEIDSKLVFTDAMMAKFVPNKIADPEDGGLSAAIMALGPDGKAAPKNNIYILGFCDALAKCARLASTFAPKEPAAQGGVPEADSEDEPTIPCALGYRLCRCRCESGCASESCAYFDRAMLAAAPTGARK